VSGGIGARSVRRGKNEDTGKRRDAEDTEIYGESRKTRTPSEESRADNAGSRVAELARGAADARVSGESGAGETRDSRLGKRVAAASVLLSGEIGARGAHSIFGNGRPGRGTGAEHV